MSSVIKLKNISNGPVIFRLGDEFKRLRRFDTIEIKDTEFSAVVQCLVDRGYLLVEKTEKIKEEASDKKSPKKTTKEEK